MKEITKKPKVFGTGLIALDLIIGLDPESPIRSWTGGTCGNVLSVLAYLGWDAFPIARMNNDPASQRVMADMKHCGVHLDFANCSPTSHTPIIIQEIRRGRDGIPTHRFSWSCPHCGNWLPRFKPVTVNAIESIIPNLPDTAVFFMDRLSRSALTLAARASANGAVVFFEPSAKMDEKLLREALQLSHIIKYSDQRIPSIDGFMQEGSSSILEVQTLGSKGLRYRHRFEAQISNWLQMDPISAPHVADTCGAGDWCTAGLVSWVAPEGRASLNDGGIDAVQKALRYGQALAAWNCGFEGARGGMYSVDREAFDLQVNALLNGHPFSPPSEAKVLPSISITCPACSPGTARKPLPSRASTGRRRGGPIKGIFGSDLV